MVIQELKPSKHVEGRWLAALEDGSVLPRIYNFVD